MKRAPGPTFFTEEQLQGLDTDELDREAFGVAGDEVVTLAPSQIEIQFHGDLENPEEKFRQGGMRWAKSVDLSEPVEVEVHQDGKFYLKDGHHRWFAARKMGRKLKALVIIKANPVTVLLERQVATGSIFLPR